MPGADLPELSTGLEPPGSPASPGSAHLLRRALTDSARDLVAALPIAASADDPEGVHAARVAARRLRSNLRTFRTLLDGRPDAVVDELRWLGATLGAARDLDVVAAIVADTGRSLEADEPTGRVVAILAAERAERQAAVREAVSSARVSVLIEGIVELLDLLEPDDRGGPRRVRRCVRQRWRRLHRAVRELPADPAPPALHRVRILAKRARYATEVLEPVDGKRARQHAAALADLQRALGERCDVELAIRTLERIAATATADGAFAAGRIAQHLLDRSETNPSEWQRAWAHARRTAGRAALA